jgi:hypothetical protein
MIRIVCLVFLLLGLTSASAQSLYTETPGAFVAIGTFDLQERTPHDRALTAEMGYRLGNGLDLSLGVRHAASRVTELDYGSESSAWEIRPSLGYHRSLSPHAVLQVNGLLNVQFYHRTSGGFSFGPTTIEATRFDADVSALLFGRVRLGDCLTVLPGAGLYHLRTIDDRVKLSAPGPHGGIWGGPGYDITVRSTGAQFALPITLHLGERSLVISPTLRYALSDTYQILERVVDLNLRLNF